jgi:hypothetical protein
MSKLTIKRIETALERLTLKEDGVIKLTYPIQ